MWKSKTRVTSPNPRVASSNSQVTSSNSRVLSSNQWVTRSNSWVRTLKAPVARSYEYIRVERENSEFKILNFTSYKKLHFHCSASIELNPHKKVLDNPFHNMAQKNLYVTPKLPTYFIIGQWLCSLLWILTANTVF